MHKFVRVWLDIDTKETFNSELCTVQLASNQFILNYFSKRDCNGKSLQY